MVRLLPTPVGDASLQKDSLELALVARMLHLPQHGRVGEARDVVGFANQGNLILVFDDAALVNGVLDGGKVFLVEGEEGDVVGDLVLNRPDGRVRGLRVGCAAEEGVDFVRREDFVDVVDLEGFGGGEGKARPYDAVASDIVTSSGSRR